MYASVHEDSPARWIYNMHVSDMAQSCPVVPVALWYKGRMRMHGPATARQWSMATPAKAVAAVPEHTEFTARSLYKVDS